MARRVLTIEQTLTLLAATPTRLAALTAGLTPAQLRTPPSPDEWSANDVLAHLRACADVRGGPIATILAEDTPTIRAVNPLTWIQQTDYL
ncbi:MAG: DinB family protein, partial [Ktedonobacterales bacterium]